MKYQSRIGDQELKNTGLTFHQGQQTIFGFSQRLESDAGSIMYGAEYCIFLELSGRIGRICWI